MTAVDVAEVIDVVRKFVGRRGVIDGSTRIYHDLHIAGDDAGELLDEIAKRFGVSFEGLDFHRYFPNESDAFFYFLARRFLGYRDRRHAPLTVGHLTVVAQRGAWFDPV